MFSENVIIMINFSGNLYIVV